jgi:glycerate 2-kinase
MIQPEKQILSEIFNAALKSIDPYKAVSRHTDEIIKSYNSGKYENLYVLSFGKAASAMARASIDFLDKLVTGGIVITKYGHTGGLKEKHRLKIFEAGHPVPDETGYNATKDIIRLLENSDEKTYILCLISGGGSSLLVAPYNGISLKDKQDTTRLLLNCGADIFELNAVRKHISLVKGGRLAAISAAPAIESLILSDVLNDRLDVIASGPFIPDETTFKDAFNVIQKYSIDREIPKNVLELLQNGIRGHIPETPKRGDPVFDKVSTRIVGNIAKAIEAAKEKAEQLGFNVEVVDKAIHGEAREAGSRLARRALKVKTKMIQENSGRSVCLISGGETTVTVRGHGIGGRNMELALAFAVEIDGKNGITFLSAGTDGGDGPTDSAGAIVDGDTVLKGRANGIDPEIFLQNNDSYNYFKKTDDLLITGPTGTNVMDLQIALIRV